MRDKILESIFLDTSLWREVIEHGVDKHIPHKWLDAFADPHVRADLCGMIGDGEYSIQPPHTGYRKKDDGGERMFLANEPQDRLLLNVIYKWLMHNEAKMIHPACKSYQTGIGVGKIVKEISQRTTSKSNNEPRRIVGRKFDIHKYFDTIGREYINAALNAVEKDFGRSSIIDLLREYYDSDIYYDTRQRALVEQYQGIKQGCAVSAWLANVLLYSLDEELSQRGGLYVRYSDDILYLGEDYQEVTELIRNRLAQMGLQLNEKKVTNVVAGEYFCFLGFDIHGRDISLSRKWVKHFQQEIDRRTIRNALLIKKVRAIRQSDDRCQEQKLRHLLNKAMRDVARFLLYGNGRYSWATQVLPTINNSADLQQLTTYCLDALRAVYTGHTHIGGLGKSLTHGIQRGKGRHVKANLIATQHLLVENGGISQLPGFLSLLAVQRAVCNKWLFRTLVANMVDTCKHPLYGPMHNTQLITREKIIAGIESHYESYLHSQPNGEGIERFYAQPLEEMTIESLIQGSNRHEALASLEQYIKENVEFSLLQESPDSWYWQSEKLPQLILLKEWFLDTNNKDQYTRPSAQQD